MALTEKMKSFCREYFANGGNGTKAYLVAYDTTSEVTAANEASILLKRADINEYIKTLNIPLENKAISEREKKRSVLWAMIDNPATSDSDRCRALDILNKMDMEYVNINRNIDDNSNLENIDTSKLLQFVSTA